MGTGQNCKKTMLHEGTKLHEGNFAPRVNFARVTILHKSRKNYIYKKLKKLKDKLIKQQMKKSY